MSTRDIGKKAADIGIYVALAMIIGYIEMLIPFSIGIPGIKLGLANIVVVIVLYRQGTKTALVVSIMRIFLLGFLFGNLSVILYSIAGGIVSIIGMCLIKKVQAISVIGVSICGGIAHNIGQIVIAIMVVENIAIMTYLPVLLIAGMITGSLTGVVAKEIMKRIR